MPVIFRLCLDGGFGEGYGKEREKVEDLIDPNGLTSLFPFPFLFPHQILIPNRNTALG